MANHELIQILYILFYNVQLFIPCIGLNVVRYDFSEAQDGKGACDRKIDKILPNKKIHLRTSLSDFFTLNFYEQIFFFRSTERENSPLCLRGA